MFATSVSSLTLRPTLPRRCCRSAQAPIAACPLATQQGPHPDQPSSLQAPSRRIALVLAGAGVLWPLKASAEGSPPTLDSPPAAVVPPTGDFKTYNEKDFVLEVPRSFREVREENSGNGGFGSGGRPRSTYERLAESTPLRVKFTSDDHQEQLTVIQRNASEIKQSIFQITDLSQLGDLSAVAALLLPREVTVEAQGSAIIERPERDTGTILGSVKSASQTVYRYTFRTRGQHAHLSVVAKGGKLYLTAGSAADAKWQEASKRLKEAVVSFRLV